MRGLKAGCEQVVESTYGSRCTIVRPHYVVGPGDSTDRFTYWVARVARGGQVLAPGSANDPLQYIDVRDLAAFVRRCAEERPSGRFNACTPPGAHTMGELMETSKRVSGSNATFVWADADFIQKNGLMEKGEIPIWLPPTGPLAGALLVSSAHAVQQGLRFRDLDDDRARYARLAQQASGGAAAEAGRRPDPGARSRVAEASWQRRRAERARWRIGSANCSDGDSEHVRADGHGDVEGERRPDSANRTRSRIAQCDRAPAHPLAARLHEATPLAYAAHRRPGATSPRRIGRARISDRGDHGFPVDRARCGAAARQPRHRRRSAKLWAQQAHG